MSDSYEIVKQRNYPILALLYTFDGATLFHKVIVGVCIFSGKCDVPLGLEDGRIPNPMFRASSSYNFYCAARNARLHQRRAGRNGGAWCSRHRNNRQWLQVDFGTDAYVTRVSTQGRHNSDQWVTSYYVSFSSRGQRFITYREGRRTKVSTLLFINCYKSMHFLIHFSPKIILLTDHLFPSHMFK